jgi:hypothetical protein
VIAFTILVSKRPMHIPNRYSTIHAAILYIFCTNTNSTTLTSNSSKTNKYGFWTPKKEKWYSHSWTKKTSHLGSYAVRENNGSGIYDVFDTYDFNEAIENRNPGY